MDLIRFKGRIPRLPPWDFADLRFLYAACLITIALVYSAFMFSRHELASRQVTANELVQKFEYERDLDVELERLVAFAQERQTNHFAITARELVDTYRSLREAQSERTEDAWLSHICYGRPCRALFDSKYFSYTPEALEAKILDAKLSDRAYARHLQTVFAQASNYDLALRDAIKLVFQNMNDRNTGNRRFDLLAYLTLMALLILQAVYVFRPAIARMNASLTVRSDFLSRISHEIRNPMNSILGMAEILRGTSLNYEQQQYVGNLQRSGHALLDMLNNLVDFSLVEKGKMVLKPEPFNLFECIDRAMNLIAIPAHHKNLNLHLIVDPETPNLLVGDGARIDQLLINLLSNASKFTEQGDITLAVEVLSQSEKDVDLRFTVSDTGIGMPSDLTHRIFESFVQGDSSIQRKHGGPGLGLSIAREIVRLMGGKIMVKSEAGKGSAFTFGLYLEKQDGSKCALAPLRSRKLIFAAAAGKIDGYLSSYTPIAREVACAESAAELRSVLEGKELPDEVLIDDTLGIIAMINCRNICEEFSIGRAAVALIRSNFTKESMDLLQRNGFTRFLIKPLKPWELLTLPVCSVQKAAAQDSVKTLPLDQLTKRLRERRLRVLLVDDSNDNLFLLKEVMQPVAEEIHFAENGLEGVEQFKANHYDAVFMDIQMPIMDGYTAIRKMRALETHTQRPIYAVTAHSGLVDAQKCREAGFTDRILKPVTRQEIYHSLARAFAMEVEEVKAETSHPSDPLLPEKYLRRLMPVYFKTRFDDMAKLNTAIELRDFEALKKLGHKIKGSAASYGFPKAAELSQFLEDAAYNADLGACDRTVGELREMFKSEYARFQNT